MIQGPFRSKYLVSTSSQVRSVISLYSDSAFDLETMTYFLLFHDTRFPPTKTQYPLVGLISIGQPVQSTVQRLGRVGDESAESYPSRPAPRRVRVTSWSTQLRGDRLGRESELTRSTRHYDDDFVSHRSSM